MRGAIVRRETDDRCAYILGPLASTPLQSNRDSNSGATKHLDEGVDAEQLDSPAHEITHARLGDTE